MSEWQDISTAPEDGTEVLVCEPRVVATMVLAARWIEGEGWYEVNNDPSDVWGFGVLHPTHWMPLPEPPQPSLSRESV